MLGGLIEDRFEDRKSKVPVLGDIPYLGALFRSSEFQKNKTELLIVVTPRLVKPLTQAPTLPTDNHVVPSRAEVIFGGKLEGAGITRLIENGAIATLGFARAVWRQFFCLCGRRRGAVGLPQSSYFDDRAPNGRRHQ